MITADEFRRRWLVGTSHENTFEHHERSEIQHLGLAAEAARFLQEVGLPTYGAGFFFGDSPRVMEGTRHVIMGDHEDSQLIAVDTSGMGHVLWIQRGNASSPAWFNESIPILCESMLLHLELCNEANTVNRKLAVYRNNVTDFLIDHFEEALLAIDARADEDREAFWNRKFYYMRSHAVDPQKKIFRPDIPLTAS